jgi:DNA integrity scanning protein DisA with diadenylate cyclase activity
MFEKISAKLQACSPEICRPIIELAVEIAREGREGRRIGTLFNCSRLATLRRLSPIHVLSSLILSLTIRRTTAAYGTLIYEVR